MNTLPYFLENSNYPVRRSLEDEINTDIIIVGAGMAGISAAYALSKMIEPSAITVIEAGQVGSSTTGFSSGILVDSVEEDYGDMDKDIHGEVQHGIEGIINAIESEQLSCGLQKMPSFYLATDRNQINSVMREYAARRNAGFNVRILNEAGLDAYGNAALKAMVNEDGTCFNPFAFCQEMAKLLESRGVKIYEQTKLNGYDSVKKVAVTQNAQTANTRSNINYGKLILTNSSAHLEELRRKALLLACTVAVTEPLPSECYNHIFGNGEYLGWDSSGVNYVYFRPVEGHRLMIGGADRLVNLAKARKGVSNDVDNGLSNGLLTRKKDIASLRQSIERIFHSIHFIPFSHVWTGIIPSSVDGIPLAGEFEQDHYLGLYNPGLPNAFRVGQILAQSISQNASGESDANVRANANIGADMFRYDRAIPLTKMIRSLSKYEPFTTLANAFYF